jgi:hypothetical protein
MLRVQGYEVVVEAIKEETSPEIEARGATHVRVGRTLLSDNAWRIHADGLFRHGSEVEKQKQHQHQSQRRRTGVSDPHELI